MCLCLTGGENALALVQSVWKFNVTSHSKQLREKRQMPLWRFPLFEPRFEGRNSMFSLRLILTEDEGGSEMLTLLQPVSCYNTAAVSNMCTSCVCWYTVRGSCFKAGQLPPAGFQFPQPISARVRAPACHYIGCYQGKTKTLFMLHTHGKTSLGVFTRPVCYCWHLMRVKSETTESEVGELRGLERKHRKESGS